ncbi:Hypothetical predicted protein, partial [Mytilus galloprovincialis]
LPDECLPWMAAESIQDCIFSSKSEIYAFGVFLWEVMSLGEDAGIVKSKLSEGELLPKPDCCEKSLYRLMMRCWSEAPTNRPTLDYIYQHISDAIDNTEESPDQDLPYGPAVYISCHTYWLCESAVANSCHRDWPYRPVI